MKKTTLDMTKGSVLRAIVMFSIPALIGNFLNQVYSITDSIIVGRILGLDALAAIGCTMPIVLLLAAMMIGINVGVSILLSQAYGSRNIQLMRRTFANSLYLGLAVAAFMALFGVFFAKPILRLMGTPDGPFNDAVAYLQICFLTTVCPLFYYLLSCAYRGMGDSRTDLYCLILSVVSNVFFDYFFVAKLNWGVAGSAWATALAQLISAVFAAVLLFIKYPEMRLGKEDILPDVAMFIKITKLAVPIALQTAFNNLGNIIAQAAVNAFGAVAMAAYTAAGRVGAFALMPLETIGNTLSVYTGQNYGAKNPKRIMEGVRVSLVIQLVISTVLGLLLVLFGREISGWFLEEQSAEMLSVSYNYLLITAVPGIIAGVMFVYQQLLRGMGNTRDSMYSGFVQLGVKIAIIAFGFFGMRNMSAIWLSWPLSFAMAAVFAMIKCRKLNYHTLTA